MVRHDDLGDLKAALRKELGPYECCTPDFHEKAFAGIQDDAAINDFLSRTSLYDSVGKTWTEIKAVKPRKGKKGVAEKDLYQPFGLIFAAILKYFNLGDTRRVIGTKTTKLAHSVKGGEKRLSSSPAFLILGRNGDFFPNTEFGGPDYVCCASPIEIKTESNSSLSENKFQVAVYAR